jgi:hypothetical protein
MHSRVDLAVEMGLGPMSLRKKYSKACGVSSLATSMYISGWQEWCTRPDYMIVGCLRGVSQYRWHWRSPLAIVSFCRDIFCGQILEGNSQAIQTSNRIAHIVAWYRCFQEVRRNMRCWRLACAPGNRAERWSQHTRGSTPHPLNKARPASATAAAGLQPGSPR